MQGSKELHGGALNEKWSQGKFSIFLNKWEKYSIYANENSPETNDAESEGITATVLWNPVHKECSGGQQDVGMRRSAWGLRMAYCVYRRLKKRGEISVAHKT